MLSHIKYIKIININIINILNMYLNMINLYIIHVNGPQLIDTDNIMNQVRIAIWVRMYNV